MVNIFYLLMTEISAGRGMDSIDRRSASNSSMSRRVTSAGLASVTSPGVTSGAGGAGAGAG